MRSCEIAIIGCGPAGLTAALLLARDGHRVTLFDRFDAPRPIGSGLMIQPTGLAVLGALGLAGPAVASGAPITRLHGRTAAGRIVLDAPYADLALPGAFGLGIHRASLFALLFGAVSQAGISVLTGHEATGSELRGGGRRLSFAGRADAGPFELVIDAGGLRSALAPPCGRWLEFGALWATLPWPEDGPFAPDLLEQRYRGAAEMIGILPTGRRQGGGKELALFWSLRADQYEGWRRRGLDAWREEVARLWPDCLPLAARITSPGDLAFARYAHRTLPAPAQERLIHIGDAWHSASPQLGQGANMALLDAWAVREALRLARDPAAVPQMTVQLRAWHVTLYQHLTAVFTPLYQSGAAWPPLLRDRVLAPLARHYPARAIQAALVSGLVGAPLGRLGLAAPDFATLRQALEAEPLALAPAMG